METLWVATGNEHKKEEFQQRREGQAEIKTLKDLGRDLHIDETGTTFEENALIKARALHEATGQPAIADDSGLEVDAMDKGPGVYSSRFMGEDTDYKIKNQAIIDFVKDKDRRARFVCVIAWIDEKGQEHVYRGTMEGQIHTEILGENGFGYDPIFYYPPFKTTNGNVSADVKNSASHRHAALMQFVRDWKNRK